MKKLVYILLAVFALTSCREEPDLSELSSDFLVFTNYDKSTEFSNMKNYYMPDSVLVIGNEDKAEYWTGDQAAPYLEAYEENMQSFGYTRVATKAEAALGLQISYVQSTQYFVGYSYPYWWDSYPGYWGPGYWGNWGYWYYPYNIVYSYHVGSLLTEMVDLRVPQGQETKLTVVWNSFMSGLLTGSNTINTALAVQAIDQSFVQSPYLNITSLAQ